MHSVGAGDQLKIAPEDLRMRVWVSQQLSAATRSKLKHLAKFVPLPRENGVVQTDTILKTSLGNEELSEGAQRLRRYYFLIARLESSHQFSREFFRRRKLLREGITLLNQYIDETNILTKRGVGSSSELALSQNVASFPLTEVGWEESQGQRHLKVLHKLPEPRYSLGRENLKILRSLATEDRELLEQRLSDLNKAEEEFLAEASAVGKELIEMRSEVSKLVRRSRAGLPFSF